MDHNLYVKLVDQVARQTTELAALDAGIAVDQPGVDALQALLTTATMQRAAATGAVETAATQLGQLQGLAEDLRRAIDALQPGDERAALLIELDAARGQLGRVSVEAGAARQALTVASQAEEDARASLAGPKAALDELKGRAGAIRDAIERCQQQMQESGLNPTAEQLAAVRSAASAEAARIAAVDGAIGADAVIASLKGMTNAQYDAWWTNNVTNLAQLNGVVKRLARVVIRRVL